MCIRLILIGLGMDMKAMAKSIFSKALRSFVIVPVKISRI